MSAFLIVLVILVALVGVVAGLFIGPYNALVRLRNTLQEAWRQVDVELNRRYDLIPNLVETVKGYATHEHNTLSDIVALRNQARQMDAGAVPTQERGAVESQLTGAVGNLIAVAEAYPELKADAGFRQLASQLSETEDRIANSRRYYNAVVGDYNTKVESFPSNVSATMFHFEKAAYFQVDDPTMRQTPAVDFGELGYGSGVQRPGAAQTPQIESGQFTNPVTPPQTTATPQPDPGQIKRREPGEGTGTSAS